MHYLYLTFSWFFGLVFWVWGVSGLRFDIGASLACIAISALLLPPIRDFTYKHTQRALSTGTRGAAIFCLLAVSVWLTPQ
ncbi:MAG TPA: hypothetical protein DCS35_17845 [Vibrio sp.]|nr:hypothetical protein [Vibrio sp.]